MPDETVAIVRLGIVLGTLLGASSMAPADGWWGQSGAFQGCRAFPSVRPGHAESELAMRVLQTRTGTRFGVFGEKPATPAPTLFVFAVGMGEMEKLRVYSETGRQLAQHGWLYVTLDPPCHGRDRRPNEPAELSGWAHRVQHGEDLMRPFVHRCVEVLDHLIAEGYTDAARVAACGTSRGGFCALHFAAAEPRVRAVAGISSVTNLLVLREFSGQTEEQLQAFNILSLADRLAGRAVWLSIGNEDQRVGTDDCVALARRLVTQSRRRHPETESVPVELIVGPSAGHRAIADAYTLAARFILKRL